jgi:prepilin-type N-terminal cleavage/methylation domain-containing protein
MMRPRARGFTLTEAALAMALVGIIAVAAIGLYASVSQTFTATRKAAMLNDRAQSAIDYMMHDLRSIGGNGIPASSAIFIEDAAGVRSDPVTGFPDGSDAAAATEGRVALSGMADRLTTFTAIKNVPPCPITAMSGPTTSGEGTAQFLLTPCPGCNPRINPGTCCFTMGNVRPFVRTVMLMKDDAYRPVLLTNASGTCVFRWQDVVPSSMRSSQPAAMSDYEGGSAVLVDFRTYYLDAQTHDLMMHLDTIPGDPPNVGDILNGYGATPTVLGERFRVLDGVYDFQISLGYDLDASGDVDDGSEWLYDLPGETTSSLSGYRQELLRLVRVEIVVGIPMGGARGGAGVLSPARAAAPLVVPRVGLRAAGQRFAPRNVDAGGGL